MNTLHALCILMCCKSMREAAGQSIKSSVFHTWIRDTRDAKFPSSRGYFTKLFHELAGLGGDVSFYKTEAETRISRPLLPGLVSLASLMIYTIGLTWDEVSLAFWPFWTAL